MERSGNWEYYATEEYWFIYWNYWKVAWPFASTEHKENPWEYDPEFDDWWVKWDDIKAVYKTCWE